MCFLVLMPRFNLLWVAFLHIFQFVGVITLGFIPYNDIFFLFFGEEHIIKLQCPGVATLEKEMDDFEQVIDKADAAMYEAKRAGKNRVMSL